MVPKLQLTSAASPPCRSEFSVELFLTTATLFGVCRGERVGAAGAISLLIMDDSLGPAEGPTQPGRLLRGGGISSET